MPTLACITLADRCVGHEIMTIENQSADDSSTPCARRLSRKASSSAGSVPRHDHVRLCASFKNPQPDRGDIIRSISGNLCRAAAIKKSSRQSRKLQGIEFLKPRESVNSTKGVGQDSSGITAATSAIGEKYNYVTLPHGERRFRLRTGLQVSFFCFPSDQPGPRFCCELAVQQNQKPKTFAIVVLDSNFTLPT